MTPYLKLATDVELLKGGFGHYMALYDGRVHVRVVSTEDWQGEVYGDISDGIGSWKATAALVLMAWENAVDVVYGVSDLDRDVAWKVARSMAGYTAITNEYFCNGEWTVIVMRSLAQA